MYIVCKTPALPFIGTRVSATVTPVCMPPPCWLTVVSLPLKIAGRVVDTPGNRLRLACCSRGVECPYDDRLCLGTRAGASVRGPS